MSSLETTSGSNITRLSSLESKTGSYATTGSNTFVGGQYLSSSFNPTGFSTTASLYTDGGLRVSKDAYISGTLYLNNVTVYGTQSVAYITSSQLNISTNLISVNTSTPSVRFGGLAVYDSGSTGLTGSILWDSENNRWIYSNPSGSTYDGGMFISGPRNSSGLGSETGTTACMLLAGQGGDHLTSSMIYHSSTATCFYGNSYISASGEAIFNNTVCGLRFLWSSGSTESFLTTGGGNTAIGNGGTAGLTLYSSNSPRLCISSTGESTFSCRVCSSGISTNASLVMNSSAPINFSGTGGYISMYSRRAGGSCGAMIVNNGTGQNLWFGEVAGNIYGLGAGGAGTDYTGTPLLNLDVANQRIGIGTFGPLGALHICLPTALAYIQSTTGGANAETRFITSYRTWGVGTNIGLSGCQFEIYDVSAGANRFVIDVNGNVGIGRTIPDVKFEVCTTNTGSDLLASFKNASDANGEYTAIRVGNGNKFAYMGMLLQPGDVAYFHTACNPFTNSCGIYLTEAGKVGIGLCQPKSRLDLAVSSTNTSAGCFNASTINLTDPTTVGAYSQITFGYTEGRVYAASYIGHVSLNSWSGGYGDLVFGVRNCGNDIQPTEKLRITGCNSIIGYSQWYTSYTAQRATPNGGINTVRIIEDALGQWVQVGRFSCDASSQIGNTFSSVTGMSTVTCQTAQTQFSSDWGGSIPTEIRILGATDFDKWRETRTVDFVYRNIPGRPWCLFFNGGNTDGNYTTTGTARYGFNTCGTYDGFGRWNSPNNCMIGMSDAAYSNPSSAYTTPTANAFNWYTAQDAKLTAIANNTVYSGQDANWTTGFGYDDGAIFFNDVYPSTTAQGGPATYSSAVWILLKFN